MEHELQGDPGCLSHVCVVYPNRLSLLITIRVFWLVLWAFWTHCPILKLRRRKTQNDKKFLTDQSCKRCSVVLFTQSLSPLSLQAVGESGFLNKALLRSSVNLTGVTSTQHKVWMRKVCTRQSLDWRLFCFLWNNTCAFLGPFPFHSWFLNVCGFGAFRFCTHQRLFSSEMGQSEYLAG